MMNAQKLFLSSILSTVLLSLPYGSVAFAESNRASSSTWGVRPSKTPLFSSPTTTESNVSSDNILTVKAPLKFIGPYPCLALRFPKLATSGQRAQGKAGVSLDFTLDTAANTNTIQDPIAQELACPKGASGAYILGDTQLDGVMEELFLTDLGASALSGVNLNAAGLLSLQFFKLFGGGVEFQWTGRPTLTFYSGKTPQATQDKSPVPIERLAGSLPSITLLVNGVEIKALLATGSPITVMNEAAAKAAGVERMMIAKENRKAMEADGNVVAVMDANGKPVDLVKSQDPVEVKAAAVEFGKVPVYVGEIPGMAALTASNDEPAIVLGLDVLVQRPAMLLRIQDNEVWFS